AAVGRLPHPGRLGPAALQLRAPPGRGAPGAEPARRADAEDVGRACASRTAIEIEEAVIREGGCAAAMRTRAEWLAHPQSRAVAGLPLIGLARLPGPSGPHEREASGAPDRPLRGVRVLDLSRVIAGPVAARTLAAHGAEVLRVGAARSEEHTSELQSRENLVC